MYGLGVIVNGLVIVGASFAALILKKFIMKFDKNNKVEKISDTIMSGLAFCIIYMGISGALECQHVLICIISSIRLIYLRKKKIFMLYMNEEGLKVHGYFIAWNQVISIEIKEVPASKPKISNFEDRIFIYYHKPGKKENFKFD